MNRFRRLDRMKKISTGLCGAGLLALASCSSVHTDIHPNDAVRQKVHWFYDKHSVTLDVSADPNLNQSDKRPHTLVLGILELQDPNDFLPLVQNPDRAMETLAAGKKRTGVLEIWRFVVPPGAHQKVTVDRMRHAMYLGVIAGYSGYSPAQDIVLRPLPVLVRRSGIIFRSNHYRPAKTLASVSLGSHHLLGVNVVDPQKESPAKKTNKKKDSPGSGSGSQPIRPL